MKNISGLTISEHQNTKRVINIDILKALGSGYESYASDIEGAMEKLADGAYSIFDSRQYLRYLMRSQFTNE